MATTQCPYFQNLSNTCKPYGSKPADHTKKTKCLSTSEEWRKCENYKQIQKRSK